MEDSPMSGLPGPIPPDRGPESSPNEVLTAKLQAQDLQLKALTTQLDQLQHTIQQLTSLLTLKNGEPTSFSGIAGINTPIAVIWRPTHRFLALIPLPHHLIHPVT